jgi:hypothetical protein
MKKFIILTAACAGFYTASSQSISRSVISSWGEFTSNSYAQLESNCGEVLVATLTSAANIVTQGFIQPPAYLFTNGPSVESSIGPFRLYPNPAENNTVLVTPGSRYFSITVTDVRGRDVSAAIPLEKSFSGNAVEINTTALNKGVYFIKIIDADTNGLIEVLRFVKI